MHSFGLVAALLCMAVAWQTALHAPARLVVVMATLVFMLLQIGAVRAEREVLALSRDTHHATTGAWQTPTRARKLMRRHLANSLSRTHLESLFPQAAVNGGAMADRLGYSA